MDEPSALANTLKGEINYDKLGSNRSKSNLKNYQMNLIASKKAKAKDNDDSTAILNDETRNYDASVKIFL